MTKENNSAIDFKRPCLPHYFGRLLPGKNVLETFALNGMFDLVVKVCLYNYQSKCSNKEKC